MARAKEIWPNENYDFAFYCCRLTSHIHFSQGISLCEIFMACVSHPFKRNSLRIVIFLFGNPLSIESLLVRLTYSTSFLSLSLWFTPNGSYLTSSNLSKILLNKAKRKKTQPEKYARRKLLLSTWLALFGFWVDGVAFSPFTPATNIILSKFFSFIFLFGIVQKIHIVFKRKKRLNSGNGIGVRAESSAPKKNEQHSHRERLVNCATVKRVFDLHLNFSTWPLK